MAQMKLKAVSVSAMIGALAIGLVLGALFQKYHQPTNPLDTTRKSETSIPEEYQGKLQLFILAGQSNMSGWGDMPASGTDSDPRIYVFGNDYHWKLARDPVDDPGNQVDQVSKDTEAGFGPALPFATAILERYLEIVIGLIPCATGKSSIYEWRRNLGDDTLYGSCLKRVRAASVMSNVAALLFFQGEADALDPKTNRKRTLLPDRWENQFTILVGDWRNDFNSPELPIVFAQIGTTIAPDKYPNWSIVQQHQQAVDLPVVAMITTEDLPVKDDVPGC